MNIYRIDFTSRCPVNGDLIFYSLEIQSAEMIMAEKIETAVNGGPALHEQLADELHMHFRGKQILKARHGNVSIETIRGDQ